MEKNDFLYVMPAAALSGFSVFSKTIQYPLFASRDTLLKSFNEGLYHITSDENADSIINSKELMASSRISSYGIHKRCFLFAGIPDFENVCVNSDAKKTLTAVRVKLPYEKLAEFDYRGANDGAVTYKGNLNLEGATLEKVRLGLKEKDGKLFYSQISEEEYKDYKLNLSEDNLRIVENNMVFGLRRICAGLRREVEILDNNIKKILKDESSGYRRFTREDYIEENSDLFSLGIKK